ncbi:hypothetical protein ACOMHN_018799 [Nucella lapillus]
MLSHQGLWAPLSAMMWLSTFTLLTMAMPDPCSYITNPSCRCLHLSSSSPSTQPEVNCSFHSQAAVYPIISDTMITANISLRTLNVSHNALADLPYRFFQGIYAVHKLDLSNNNFTQVPPALATLHDLKVLDLSRNLIGWLSLSHVASVQGLLTLDLSGNRIGDLAGQGEAAVRGGRFLSLQSLNLSRNSISSIRGGVFSPMPHLTTLDLSHNRLSAVVDATFSPFLYSLSSLDLSHNLLPDLPPLSLTHLPHLHHLSLAHNPLREVTGVSFPVHLRSLDLSHCTLTIINHCQLTALPDLGSIQLRGNHLRCSCQLYLLLEWYQDQHHKEGNMLTSDDADAARANWTCTPSPNAQAAGVSPARGGAQPVRDLQGCQDSPSQCPTLEHAQGHHNGTSQLEVTLAVVSSGDRLMASWTFTNTGQLPVHGFQLHYLPEDGPPLASPPLPPSARSFVTPQLQLEKHYAVCLSVLGPQGVVLGRRCCSVGGESRTVISGALAAAVFLAPCLAVLLYVTLKDRRIHSQWRRRYRSLEETGDAGSQAHAPQADAPPQIEVAPSPVSRGEGPAGPSAAAPGDTGGGQGGRQAKTGDGSASTISLEPHLPTIAARGHNPGKDHAVRHNAAPHHCPHDDPVPYRLSPAPIYQLAFIYPPGGATDTEGNSTLETNDGDATTATQTPLQWPTSGRLSHDPACHVGIDNSACHMGIDNPVFMQDRGADYSDQSQSTHF